MSRLVVEGGDQTHSSFNSKSNAGQTTLGRTMNETHLSAEQARVDKEFRYTATDLHQRKMNSTYNDVQDSGLDYTMVNLTTIDRIDEELMYKPILNVSVVGRLDNLKVPFWPRFQLFNTKVQL